MHLLVVARSLMFSSYVLKHFWEETVLIATYLINRTPSRNLQLKAPYHIIPKVFPHSKVISTLNVKVFGCFPFVYTHPQHCSKLNSKSIKCIFLGYSPNQKEYKCYSPITRNFCTSMDVTLFENQLYYPKPEIQGENIREYQLWNIVRQSKNPTCLSLPQSNSIQDFQPLPSQPQPETTNYTKHQQQTQSLDDQPVPCLPESQMH